MRRAILHSWSSVECHLPFHSNSNCFCSSPPFVREHFHWDRSKCMIPYICAKAFQIHERPAIMLWPWRNNLQMYDQNHVLVYISKPNPTNTLTICCLAFFFSRLPFPSALLLFVRVIGFSFPVYHFSFWWSLPGGAVDWHQLLIFTRRRAI